MTPSPPGRGVALVNEVIGIHSSSSNGDNSPQFVDSATTDQAEPTRRSASPQQKQLTEEEAELMKEFHPADGGCAAWLVCFTAFCTNGTIFSVINSFGIVSQWLIDNYGASKSLAGSIGSAVIGTMFFFSFLASIVTDRLGIRPVAAVGGAICALGLLGSSFCDRPDRVTLLLFTHSFIFGIGAALVYTPSLVILGHHFERHMGLVNGIVTLGSGVFSVALTQMMKPVLLDGIGLSNTFRLLAGLALLIVAYVATWRPMRPTRHTELDHYLSPRNSLAESVNGIGTFLARFCNVSIWRSRGFLVWIVAHPCAMFGYFVPFAFLPNFLQQRALLQYNITTNKQLNSIIGSGSNISSGSNGSSSIDLQRLVKQSISNANSDAAMLLICINVASSVARLAIGKLADSRCCHRVHLQQAAFAVLGVSMLLMPPSHHRALIILLALLFGLCDGVVVCLTGPIAFDLVGPSGASQAIGFLLLAISLPIASGPLLAGYINDVTDRWDISFYISGLLQLLAACIMFCVPLTMQTYPAVSFAEDFDQTAKANLDIAAYKEAQARDAGKGWSRVASIGGESATNASRRSLPLRLTGPLESEPPAPGAHARSSV